MKIISSTQNPEIKALVKLSQAQERKQQQRFLVEGQRALATFIHAGHKPIHLYATEHLYEQATTFVSKDLITVVSESVMNKISPTKTPSGILGVFPIPPRVHPSLLGPGLVLAQLADPGNMGTLIRTCAAMGKKTVVVIEGADVWNPKVVQASAGTLALVTIFEWTWADLIQHKKNLNLCALVVSGGKRPEPSLLKNALLVVGSEAHGIPAPWLADCDTLITLPMPGKTESLNAAVAGSIALYLAQTP